MNTKSILIYVSGLLIAGLLGLIISWIFNTSLEINIIFSICIISILWLAPLTLKRYKNRRNDFDILLEVVSPEDWLAPITASIFAVIALFLVGISIYSLEFYGLIPALAFFLASLNGFISGTKFQKNGLMINNDFIEWENINSYSWIHSQNAQKIVLLLEYKRQLAFLDFGVVSFKLKVAPEDRDKIESVFEKYLPNKLSQKARA